MLSMLLAFLLKRLLDLHKALKSIGYACLKLKSRFVVSVLDCHGRYHPGIRVLFPSSGLWGVFLPKPIQFITAGGTRSWIYKYGDFELHGVEIISVVRLDVILHVELH